MVREPKITLYFNWSNRATDQRIINENPKFQLIWAQISWNFGPFATFRSPPLSYQSIKVLLTKLVLKTLKYLKLLSCDKTALAWSSTMWIRWVFKTKIETVKTSFLKWFLAIRKEGVPRIIVLIQTQMSWFVTLLPVFLPS